MLGPGHDGGPYGADMTTRESATAPRGLVVRSLLAAAVFAAAVLPGWLLSDLVEQWTGAVLVGYLVSMGYGSAAIAVLAPWSSYRRRDAAFGLVPLFGFYVICVLAWRVALLPYRDWPPRGDELARSRWLDDPAYAGTWLLSPERVNRRVRPRSESAATRRQR